MSSLCAAQHALDLHLCVCQSIRREQCRTVLENNQSQGTVVRGPKIRWALSTQQSMRDFCNEAANEFPRIGFGAKVQHSYGKIILALSSRFWFYKYQWARNWDIQGLDPRNRHAQGHIRSTYLPEANSIPKERQNEAAKRVCLILHIYIITHRS